MALLTNLALFILFALAIVISGGLLVKSLLKISSFLRLTEFVVAFIIMALSTSLPELFVGITSALADKSAISLGTVIGSNIADLTLVIGIAIILAKKIRIKSKFIKRDTWWMLLFALLPMVLMFLGNSMSRIDGLILIGVFGIFSYITVKQKREFEAKMENNTGRLEILGYFFLFVFSLGLLFFSSSQVVKYGSLLAIDLTLPTIFIGLFFIALGTSLPELVFGSKAALAKHPELALGDVIGAVVVNSTLVLGVTAVISPITADIFLFLISAVFMMVICFLFVVFVQSSRIGWLHGLALVLIYIMFLIMELGLKGIIPTQFISHP